ncbi:MAG: hypothetical protein ACRC5T_10310 [Cetobacterium sp.]
MKRVTVIDIKRRKFIIELHKDSFLIFNEEKKQLRKFDNTERETIERFINENKSF